MLTVQSSAERPEGERQTAHVYSGRSPTSHLAAGTGSSTLSFAGKTVSRRRLLSVMAARMGTLAVTQSIANDIARPRQTLSRYLDLLERRPS
jgi:hypothetical protein